MFSARSFASNTIMSSNQYYSLFGLWNDEFNASDFHDVATNATCFTGAMPTEAIEIMQHRCKRSAKDSFLEGKN